MHAVRGFVCESVCARARLCFCECVRVFFVMSVCENMCVYMYVCMRIYSDLPPRNKFLFAQSSLVAGPRKLIKVNSVPSTVQFKPL